jgi:small-conductance mechanosensitive channel
MPNQFLNQFSFQWGGISISTIAIVKLILSSLLIIFLVGYLKKLLKNKILLKLNVVPGNREALANVISYTLGSLIFITILQSLGLNLSSLAVIAGSLGVGIGFGLQELTRNFVSGLTILFERKIKVGDFIEFDRLQGYVREISTRSTIIKTKDGADVVVPNSQLVENRLINWSYESFVARIHIPVGVAYGSDPVLVTETLLESAYMEASVLQNPPPQVMFMGFGDHALNFELWVWINPIDDHPQIRSSLNFIVEYNLRRHNIHIPFPQRDIWLRNPEVLGLTHNLVNDSKSLAKSPSSISSELSIKNLLKQVPYFSNFNDLELRKLIEIGYRKTLSESEILFDENEASDTFYIILSGSVEVFVAKLNKHLTNLEQGDFLGELSLILGMPRTATVKARENTILFCINKNNFQELLQRYPELYKIIIATLSQRKNELEERQKQLRELGLIDEEEDNNNPLIWVQNRLRKLFNL